MRHSPAPLLASQKFVFRRATAAAGKYPLYGKKTNETMTTIRRDVSEVRFVTPRRTGHITGAVLHSVRSASVNGRSTLLCNSLTSSAAKYRQVCSGLTTERSIHNAIISPSTQRVIKKVSAIVGFFQRSSSGCGTLFQAQAWR